MMQHDGVAVASVGPYAGADMHIAQLMPLPSLTVVPVYLDWFYLPGFTILLTAHPDSPGQWAVKRVQ